MCAMPEKLFLDQIKKSFRKSHNIDIFAGDVFKSIEALHLMVGNARVEIKVLSRNLRKDIFGHPRLIRDFVRFLENEPQRRLSIIIKEGDDASYDDHPLISQLDTLKHPHFSKHFAEATCVAKCTTSFVLADCAYFRLTKDVTGDVIPVETDPDGRSLNPKAEKRIWSVVNFGDRENCKRLDEFFDVYVDKARVPFLEHSP